MWARNVPDRHIVWPVCSCCTGLTITSFSPYFKNLRTRNYALSDGKTLVVMAGYKKGAEAVNARLEAQDWTIAELQSRIEE